MSLLYGLRPLPRSFYHRSTLAVARDLLGMHLCHVLSDELVLSGRIVEVEAYLGPGDRASHARVKQRRGAFEPYGRSTLMFGPPGVSYVYLVYGMHHCFNAVAHEEGHVGAVLVRALEPDASTQGKNLRGPARLCSVMGVDRRYNGMDLCAAPAPLQSVESLGRPLPVPAPATALLIEDRGTPVADADVAETPRIGVDYAGPDALLPYRFCDRRSRHLSQKLASEPRPTPRRAR